MQNGLKSSVNSGCKPRLIQVPEEDVVAVREFLKSRRAQRARLAADVRYREKVHKKLGGDECVWGEPGSFCRRPTDPNTIPRLYCKHHWSLCVD